MTTLATTIVTALSSHIKYIVAEISTHTEDRSSWTLNSQDRPIGKKKSKSQDVHG
jgi:hypothetical protein